MPDPLNLLLYLLNTSIQLSTVITYILSKELTYIIIPLHVITGSDHTSGFYGHGKKPVLQKVVNDIEARELLVREGESLQLGGEVRANIKALILFKNL